MSNDIRITKFKVLISDIAEAILYKCDEEFSPLVLIYDYEKLNDYGKIIIEHYKSSFLYDTDDDLEFTSYYTPYCVLDLEEKINISKEFVKYSKESNRDEAYNFIFFAMMVLAVDKSDSDEHLSLICDFIQMLKITDDEIDDILQIIKFIFHKQSNEPELKSDTTREVFWDVLDLLDVVEKSTDKSNTKEFKKIFSSDSDDDKEDEAEEEDHNRVTENQGGLLALSLPESHFGPIRTDNDKSNNINLTEDKLRIITEKIAKKIRENLEQIENPSYELTFDDDMLIKSLLKVEKYMIKHYNKNEMTNDYHRIKVYSKLDFISLFKGNIKISVISNVIAGSLETLNETDGKIDNNSIKKYFNIVL